MTESITPFQHFPRELTLRQLYAGMAMQGLLASPLLKNTENLMEELAKNSIKQADILIAELNKE